MVTSPKPMGPIERVYTFIRRLMLQKEVLQVLACCTVSSVLKETLHLHGPVFGALIMSVWAWEKTMLKGEDDE